MTKSSTVLKNVPAEPSKGRSDIKPASTLVFTWGNPSRGDDALGPHIYDLLKAENLHDVDVLTDFQLQIEHVMDLEDRERVLFIDASMSAHEPFEFFRLQAGQDDSYTTHAMSPQSLLSVYEQVNKRAPPPAFMLSIRAYEFELGSPISHKAAANLSEAVSFIKSNLTASRNQGWEV